MCHTLVDWCWLQTVWHLQAQRGYNWLHNPVMVWFFWESCSQTGLCLLVYMWCNGVGSFFLQRYIPIARSRTPTPPHWKQEQRRTVSLDVHQVSCLRPTYKISEKVFLLLKIIILLGCGNAVILKPKTYSHSIGKLLTISGHRVKLKYK